MTKLHKVDHIVSYDEDAQLQYGRLLNYSKNPNFYPQYSNFSYLTHLLMNVTIIHNHFTGYSFEL